MQKPRNPQTIWLHLRRTWPGLVWALGMSGQAWAQLHLPALDGRGEPLAPPEPVSVVISQQQSIIYLLLGVVVISILANVYLATMFLRAQFTLERMAEAIRRVDLLAEAFRVANVEWQEEIDDSVEDSHSRLGPVVDLDDEPGPGRRRVS